VSATDKAKNKAQELGGKAKEAVGRVTGDRSTEISGKHDRRSPTSKALARRSRTPSESRQLRRCHPDGRRARGLPIRAALNSDH